MLIDNILLFQYYFNTIFYYLCSMKKEITLQLDSDAIAYIEKISDGLKCSPSDFVEHLIIINMMYMKNYIESLLPHHDFEPGGYCMQQTTQAKSGEEVRPMGEREKRIFEQISKAFHQPQ